MQRPVLFLIVAAFTLSSSFAADLLLAPSETPKYQLSNIRIERDDFAREIIVIDYKRTKEGTAAMGDVRIAGKTDKGPMDVFGIQRIAESGQLRIKLSPFAGRAHNFEIYLVAGSRYGKNYMVSNAVRMGQPGQPTRARGLNAEEKKAQERAKQFATPPAAIADGLLPVTAETNLIPGMPVKAGHYGEWEDAEVISVVDSGVFLKYGTADVLVFHPREKWIAISAETLAAGRTNPDQFQASVETLPSSRLAIPNGSSALKDDLELPAGTPLLYDYGIKWRDVFAVRESFGKITLRYDGYGSNWDTTQPRSKFLINDSVLAKLSEPGIAETFAKNLIDSDSRGRASRTSFPSRGARSAGNIKHKKYPVTISVPAGAQYVPDDLRVEQGTPLAACWASKWNPITAISENDDGSLYVHWDDFSDAFDCNMTRDQLIIEDKTVRKLSRKSAANAEELKKTLRTWTDKSGQHKLEARFVDRTESEVLLKTDAGRQVKLQIEKLCTKDQDLLASVQATVENPFE